MYAVSRARPTWLIAAACAAFLAATPALAQHDHHHEGGGGHGGGGQPHGRGQWVGGQQRGGGPWARGPSPGGMPAPSPGPRYQRPYNGYTAPAPRYYPAPAPRPGAPYRSRWLRGGYLPPSFQSGVIGEYWRFNLRRPPYGYEWVQAGSEYLLVSVATGMIFDVIPAY